MSTPIPESDGRLVWIDCRVFWADMPFISVRKSDHCIIQSRIKALPKDLWVECIECTFNGANTKDPWAVYDVMFDTHLTHRAVLDAVTRASIAISNLSYFRSN